MKKYNVFYLWVVEKDRHKFICEKIYDNKFKEILTKKYIIVEESDKVKSLISYYSILEIATYKNGQILNPLMLTKKDILLKYIELNEKEKNKHVNINDFLKKQEEELKGWEILKKECPEFAKQLAKEILQGLGIIDDKENLVGPYNDILRKEKTMKC